ncbi:MAG TPA: hypothetical protein VF796_09110 [Humisphaera sp.]
MIRPADLLLALLTVLVIAAPASAADPYPQTADRAALPTDHFPDRLHAFVWRNWGLVEPARLAKVVGTDEARVQSLAVSMGLPERPDVPREMLSRGYITLIRRNWHLLPYEQLVELLGVTPDRLAHLLREDDFLYVKLGNVKPRVDRLTWAEPNAAARKRAAEIRAVAAPEVDRLRTLPAEPRFAFLKRFTRPLAPADYPPNPLDPLTQPPRFLHSYFAVFGDPLLDPALDPYPDALLKELADLGVTGVWLHVVLRDMAPGGAAFPEFGKDHERRLKGLADLVARAKRFGIGVYLYVNEPRAMPDSFFAARPELAGVRERDFVAMCTSRPEVRQWVSDALAHVFKTVPDTAGAFTITASENLTSCASHGGQAGCPRCKVRPPAEVIAEVNATIADGVRRGSPKARVIVWDWGWRDDYVADAIKRLPDDVWYQSVSEWSLPIERGGVKSVVGEYSLSSVGPGPRATRHWQLARDRGLRTVAKVQLNCTWELSSLPALPVLDLVARHCQRLAAAGVDGHMLGWSLGGHPSPNLDVARRFAADPKATPDAVLTAVAADRYGPAGAADARQAWAAFSTAFEQYPYNGNVVYHCPVQVGPANPLYAKPTGYPSTMVGIPYDDAKGWAGPYGPEVLAKQFEAVATGWDTGLDPLARAAAAAPAARRADAEADVRWARAAAIHFRSVANQARFVTARDSLAKAADPAVAAKLRQEMKRLAAEESRLARDLLPLAAADARIGFESSNHYFYVPQDLVEKVVNCRHVIDGLGD